METLPPIERTAVASSLVKLETMLLYMNMQWHATIAVILSLYKSSK